MILECFMPGNGQISFPLAATVLYGIVTKPEYWRSFSRVKKSIPINSWQWHLIVSEPTVALQKKRSITFK